MRKARSLNGLLRLRNLKERRARHALATARGQKESAAARLEAVRSGIADLAGSDAELLRPATLRALQLQGIGGAELLDAAGREYDRTKRDFDGAINRWQKAAAELLSAEELTRRKRELVARASQAAAERALDELVVLQRKRRAG